MTDRNANDETRIIDGEGNSRDSNNAYEFEAGYDDGLVHDHGWACQERGAPAR